MKLKIVCFYLIKLNHLHFQCFCAQKKMLSGNHSASSGKVGDKELFYFMTRGFDRKEAEKLLVRAKFNKVFEEISNLSIKNEILYEINQKLN